MAKGIVLNKALNDTLLSLQRTERLIDATTLRLATGLEVNSATDQPQNFFQARTLTNRANDFSRLLDGINQSIRTIEEGIIGTEAIGALLDQAEALSLDAQEKLQSDSGSAQLKGDVDLASLDALTDADGIDAGDSFDFTVGDGEDGTVTFTYTINAGDTVDDLIADINGSTSNLLRASTNKLGQLVLTSLVDDHFSLEANAADAETFRAIGLGDHVGTDLSVAAVPGDFLITQPLYRTAAAAGGAGLAVASDAISGNTTAVLEGEDGNVFNFILISGITLTDSYTITVNEDISATYTYATGAAVGSFQSVTIQGFIDRINGEAAFQGVIEAEFLEATAQIIIRPVSSDVRQIEFSQGDRNGDNLTTAFKFNGSYAADAVAGDGANDGSKFTLGGGAEPLTNFESDYDSLTEQITLLTVDARYRGINLLGGEDLTTYFNEDRDNSLITEGTDFSAAGLGVEERSFTTLSDVTDVLDRIRAARVRVRDYGTTLSNDFNIVETRNGFTKDLISNHLSSADDLVVADQNEEGANLLALQTRQALGATSLSLAAQSQSSVLSLF